MKIHQVGKGKNKETGHLKRTLNVETKHRNMHTGMLQFDPSGDSDLVSGRHSHPKPRAKYVPKGIDPAFPQKNFVQATFINRGKGDHEGWLKAKYGFGDGVGYGPAMHGYKVKNEPHGYGHKAKRGKLRLSGNSRAHRIGSR